MSHQDIIAQIRGIIESRVFSPPYVVYLPVGVNPEEYFDGENVTLRQRIKDTFPDVKEVRRGVVSRSGVGVATL